MGQTLPTQDQFTIGDHDRPGKMLPLVIDQFLTLETVGGSICEQLMLTPHTPGVGVCWSNRCWRTFIICMAANTEFRVKNIIQYLVILYQTMFSCSSCTTILPV